MSNSTAVESGAIPAPMGLLPRVIGIITAPTETYRSVVAHPRWLGMLALTLLFTAAATTAFMLTEVGQNAWLDSVITPGMADEQIGMMERMAPMAGYISAAGILVAMPVVLLLIAGILFAIFNAGMGGMASFEQVFTVLVHAGAIGIIAQLFMLPLNYMRESLTSSTSLAVMLPMFEADSFSVRLAAWVDLFVIWQMIVLAIGLGVLYRRTSGPIAFGLLAVYFCIALIVTAFMS